MTMIMSIDDDEPRRVDRAKLITVFVLHEMLREAERFHWRNA